MSGNVNVNSTLIEFYVTAQSGGGNPGGNNNGNNNNGGTGGNGGLGDFGQYDPNSEYVVQRFSSMRKGEHNLTVDKDNIPVSQVTFNTSENLTDVTIVINKTDSPARNYSGGNGAQDVYAYLDMYATVMINDTSYSIESFDELNGTQIYFNVAQGWLRERNMSKDDIVLMKYDYAADSWNELPTAYLNENNDTVYYVAESSGLGLFAITRKDVSKDTGEDGTLDKNVPDKDKEPQASVHSDANESTSSKSNSGKDSGSGVGSQIAGAVKDFMNNVKKYDMMWIVWVLIGTFVFVAAAMFVIRRHSVKNYKNELILATDREIKLTQDELTQKVPFISKDLESIKLEFSKKLSKELSRSSNVTYKNEDPFMNNIFTKPGVKDAKDADKEINMDIKKEVKNAEQKKDVNKEESQKEIKKEDIKKK
jgi:PGF-pre-PGF domain-containing protein